MSQVAHPSGDISVGYWSNQSGQITNLYASINGSDPNDADYVQSAVSPVDDYYKLIFSGLSNPQAGTITLRIRARWGTIALPITEIPFVWDAVATANNYQLQVGTKSGVYNVFNSSLGNVLNHHLDLTPGTYYARVLAYNGAILLHTGAEETVVVL